MPQGILFTCVLKARWATLSRPGTIPSYDVFFLCREKILEAPPSTNRACSVQVLTSCQNLDIEDPQERIFGSRTRDKRRYVPHAQGIDLCARWKRAGQPVAI